MAINSFRGGGKRGDERAGKYTYWWPDSSRSEVIYLTVQGLCIVRRRKKENLGTCSKLTKVETNVSLTRDWRSFSPFYFLCPCLLCRERKGGTGTLRSYSGTKKTTCLINNPLKGTKKIERKGRGVVGRKTASTG